jgi:hypothetical protein
LLHLRRQYDQRRVFWCVHPIFSHFCPSHRISCAGTQISIIGIQNPSDFALSFQVSLDGGAPQTVTIDPIPSPPAPSSPPDPNSLPDPSTIPQPICDKLFWTSAALSDQPLSSGQHTLNVLINADNGGGFNLRGFVVREGQEGTTTTMSGTATVPGSTPTRNSNSGGSTSW